MNKIFIVALMSGMAALSSFATTTSQITIRLSHTSDVHGNYGEINYNDLKPTRGGLARVSSYVKAQRAEFGENFILLDNGDMLQGQPSAYYYNFMDTTSVHLVAEIMNYLGYEVGNMGNHDVETGHNVYDRWIRQCNFPILGANIVNTANNQPYLPPYHIINRGGVKIAIIGMITPAIPAWLAENLWSGLRFDDIETSMRYWVKKVNDEEKPDLTIAMLHSGFQTSMIGEYIENTSIDIAKRIPGIDIVMCGHDHRRLCEWFDNVDGHKVLVIDPANQANVISETTVTFTVENGKVIDKKIDAILADMNTYQPDAEFSKTFSAQFSDVEAFVKQKVGTFSHTIYSRDAFFGPAAFVDIIHNIQLSLTGADVSFSAPLSFNSHIQGGDVTIADMFALMKYENMLNTMLLTGKEIKDHLEMSYALWTNEMKSADDHLLLLQTNSSSGDESRTFFKNASFNFDSAAGINYTVDVTKPAGEKVNITTLSDGTKFDLNKTYKVAINSYRSNGGGELLTKGAGIPKNELKNRIIWSTDKDLRYYLIQFISQHDGPINAQPNNNWKFVPEKLTKKAAERDFNLLFGPQK